MEISLAQVDLHEPLSQDHQIKLCFVIKNNDNRYMTEKNDVNHNIVRMGQVYHYIYK